jgi:hypothetical protein
MPGDVLKLCIGVAKLIVGPRSVGDVFHCADHANRCAGIITVDGAAATDVPLLAGWPKNTADDVKRRIL